MIILLNIYVCSIWNYFTQFNLYCSASPSIYGGRYMQMKTRTKQSQDKLAATKRSLSKMKLKVKSLQDIIKHLKRENMISQKAEDVINKYASYVPKIIVNRFLKTVKRRKPSCEAYPRS